MKLRNATPLSLAACLLLVVAPEVAALDVPTNVWTEVSREEKGARRFSSFRFVERGGFFLQWGFIGHITEYYGGPEQPPEETPEYDLVAFDPAVGRWQNHLPLDKEAEWSETLPPLYMCNSYQGITTGSYRPQLKEREGVLRPDLNIVYDQVTYDTKRHRMVYFTGGRTFAYDVEGRRWSDIGTGRAPPPVVGGSLCYDPLNDEIVLVGGGYVAETGPGGKTVGYTGTWIYECERARWRPLAGETEPPPRMASRLVYDARAQVMVLFGGDAQSHYRGDTWVYSPRVRGWRQAAVKTAPAPRAGHFLVCDAASGFVILGGGYNRKNLTDMWSFDPGADKWGRLKGEVPVGWYMTADSVAEGGLLILSTATKPEGDTMTCNEIYSVRTTYAMKLDATALVDQGPEPVLVNEMLKRPLWDAAGSEPNPERREKQLKRLEEMPDNRWLELSDPGRAAPSRTWGSCAFDTKRGRIVYWGGGHCGYGGSDYDFYDVAENTWISKPTIPMYPSRSWDKGINPAGVTFRGGPFMRHGRKVYAYDPVSDKVINTKTIRLTAGYEPETLTEIEPREVDFGEGENFTRSGYRKWVTWAFDVDTEEWEIVCSGRIGMDLTVETPRGVMAVDHNWGNLDPGNRPDAVMFRGEKVVENAVYLLDVGKRVWEKLSGDGPWPQNLYEMTALVYDSRREQLILHGGGERRDELWTFRLDDRRWRLMEPSLEALKGKAPPVCRREAVYIPSADVVFTASYPSRRYEEVGFYVYRVEENAWHRLELEPAAGRDMRAMVAQNRALTYDPARNLVLMVMGDRRGGDVGLANVYALRYQQSE